MVRKSGGQHEPVLIDWARARAGSPFEDVSSWLQSLGFWEPAVKRKHDTLLASRGIVLGSNWPSSEPRRRHDVEAHDARAALAPLHLGDAGVAGA